MGEGRKRIAVLGAQLSECYQRDFVEGCMQVLFPAGYDICVFASHTKIASTSLREIGENNIFSACNFSLFDGVIVLADTILLPGALRALEARLRSEYNGPVIFFEKQSDYYPSVIIDHYAPMYKSIEHLIQEHKYKDIAFLTGKEFHPTSKLRLKAFTQCMADNGLEVNPNRIFYGDFWYSGGEDCVDKLLMNSDKLPEVIACANDYMAIGVGIALERRGIHVPADVALMGYDSVAEGRESPSPITSIKLPLRELGSYVATCLKRLIAGGTKEDFPEFTYQGEFFYGNSCGCYLPPKLKYGERDMWKTERAEGQLVISQNNILSQMLSGADLKSAMDSIQTYTFQIRDFDSFDICINSNLADGSITNDVKDGYSERMLNVLSCGRAGEGADRLSYDEFFDLKVMLPKLFEENREPRCFIFNPLFFNDVGFGYSVLGLEKNLDRVDEKYTTWLKNVMFGLEALRKIEMLKSQNFEIKEVNYYDSLTGLYNYNGLIAHSDAMVDRAYIDHKLIGLTALDINALADINSAYGRKRGDDAIREVAQILLEEAGEGAICCRLGNDEFVVAQIVDGSSDEGCIVDCVKSRLIANDSGRDFEVRVSVGFVKRRVNVIADLEDLVNEAVSAKNRDKIQQLKSINGETLTPEEIKVAVQVKTLLDENRFNYHFQPIVDAKSGSIFAYEALMRPDIDPYIGPNVILDYAEHFGRISDVEQITFTNVLKIFEENIDKFNGRKVFINSLPGVKVDVALRKEIFSKLKQYSGQFVIELTEQREADDETVADMKELYRKCGVNVAVDDYGTGYSNVVNIMRYEPNFVKVDRLLVSGINNNQQSQHFVRDIVSFSHDNNIRVIAEGVETLDELKACISLGVDFIQGYYTAKPNAAIITAIDESTIREINEAVSY